MVEGKHLVDFDSASAFSRDMTQLPSSAPSNHPTSFIHPIRSSYISPLPIRVATLPPTSNSFPTLPSSLLLPPVISSPSPSSNPALPPASPSRPTPTAKKNYCEDEGSDDRRSAGNEDVDYIYPLDSMVNATSSEAHFIKECEDLHALSIAEMNTHDKEVCGKATGSGIGNDFITEMN
ncbi:pectinesterase inhibitor 10-like [Dendrobium catenatum]|uniref:pectinesterase inhibitor 10-like n=1 Tax=Dendrobium catenatum TaxID=906689 RepID=UPI0010A03406|nr:pectinesterase inhibitor 10-like [Dendrobium catenatum]